MANPVEAISWVGLALYFIAAIFFLAAAIVLWKAQLQRGSGRKVNVKRISTYSWIMAALIVLAQVLITLPRWKAGEAWWSVFMLPHAALISLVIVAAINIMVSKSMKQEQEQEQM